MPAKRKRTVRVPANTVTTKRLKDESDAASSSSSSSSEPISIAPTSAATAGAAASAAQTVTTKGAAAVIAAAPSTALAIERGLAKAAAAAALAGPLPVSESEESRTIRYNSIRFYSMLEEHMWADALHFANRLDLRLLRTNTRMELWLWVRTHFTLGVGATAVEHQELLAKESILREIFGILNRTGATDTTARLVAPLSCETYYHDRWSPSKLNCLLTEIERRDIVVCARPKAYEVLMWCMREGTAFCTGSDSVMCRLIRFMVRGGFGQMIQQWTLSTTPGTPFAASSPCRFFENWGPAPSGIDLLNAWSRVLPDTDGDDRCGCPLSVAIQNGRTDVVQTFVQLIPLVDIDGYRPVYKEHKLVGYVPWFVQDVPTPADTAKQIPRMLTAAVEDMEKYRKDRSKSICMILRDSLPIPDLYLLIDAYGARPSKL